MNLWILNFLVANVLVAGLALAFPVIQQVHISMGENESEMIVTWVTLEEILKDPYVEYGLDDRFRDSYAYAEMTKFKDYIYIYRAVLIDLDPGYKYYYQICGADYIRSPIFEFNSLRADSDWLPTIAIYGDFGLTNDQTLPYLGIDVINDQFDAIFHVGDFAYDLNERNGQQGNDFMNSIEHVASRVPYMTCPGNHEHHENFSHYDNRFTMVNSKSLDLKFGPFGPPKDEDQDDKDDEVEDENDTNEEEEEEDDEEEDDSEDEDKLKKSEDKNEQKSRGKRDIKSVQNIARLVQTRLTNNLALKTEVVENIVSKLKENIKNELKAALPGENNKLQATENDASKEWKYYENLSPDDFSDDPSFYSTFLWHALDIVRDQKDDGIYLDLSEDLYDLANNRSMNGDHLSLEQGYINFGQLELELEQLVVDKKPPEKNGDIFKLASGSDDLSANGQSSGKFGDPYPSDKQIADEFMQELHNDPRFFGLNLNKIEHQVKVEVSKSMKSLREFMERYIAYDKEKSQNSQNSGYFDPDNVNPNGGTNYFDPDNVNPSGGTNYFDPDNVNPNIPADISNTKQPNSHPVDYFHPDNVKSIGNRNMPVNVGETIGKDSKIPGKFDSDYERREYENYPNLETYDNGEVNDDIYDYSPDDNPDQFDEPMIDRKQQSLNVYPTEEEAAAANQYPSAQNSNPIPYRTAQNINPNQYPTAQNSNPNQYPSAQNSNPNQYPSAQNSNPSQNPGEQNNNPNQYPTAQNTILNQYPTAQVNNPIQYPTEQNAILNQYPIAQVNNPIQYPTAQVNNLIQYPIAQVNNPIQYPTAQVNNPIQYPMAQNALLNQYPTAQVGNPIQYQYPMAQNAILNQYPYQYNLVPNIRLVRSVADNLISWNTSNVVDSDPNVVRSKRNDDDYYEDDNWNTYKEPSVKPSNYNENKPIQTIVTNDYNEVAPMDAKIGDRSSADDGTEVKQQHDDKEYDSSSSDYDSTGNDDEYSEYETQEVSSKDFVNKNELDYPEKSYDWDLTDKKKKPVKEREMSVIITNPGSPKFPIMPMENKSETKKDSVNGTIHSDTPGTPHHPIMPEPKPKKKHKNKNKKKHQKSSHKKHHHHRSHHKKDKSKKESKEPDSDNKPNETDKHREKRKSLNSKINNFFYSVDLGPAHIVMFNTEFYYYTKYGWDQIKRQFEFLERDLEEANKNRDKHPWIVAMAHRPMYCLTKGDSKACDHKRLERRDVRKGIHWKSDGSNKHHHHHHHRHKRHEKYHHHHHHHHHGHHHDESDDESDDSSSSKPYSERIFGLEYIFYRYGVDLQFYGHEHFYARMLPMYNFEISVTNSSYPYDNPNGPIHVTTGSAGCREQHAQFNKIKDWVAFHSHDYGYTRLRFVDRLHVTLEQISDNQDGKIIDSVDIIKKEPMPNWMKQFEKNSNEKNHPDDEKKSKEKKHQDHIEVNVDVNVDGKDPKHSKMVFN